ncbi:MAG: nucleotide pyrophosphohydrolase [Actinomycetota bacterium]
MAKLIDVDNLSRLMRTFTEERDWAKFHSPKNLALALTGEVGELCAELQWLNDAEASADGMTPEKRAATAAELADVAIYLVQLADRLAIDLDTAVQDKMAENALRYPVATSYGSAEKAEHLPG